MEVALELAELELQQLKEGPTVAEIKNAAAQVEQARDYLEKLKDSPTTSDIAAARAQVDQAQAALDQAQTALKDAIITAPFDGVVARVGAEAGEFIMANTPMIVLVDTSNYHVVASIDEADIGKVSEGQKVALTLDAFPGEQLDGIVSLISPISTMEGGVVSYDVRININPTDLPLRTGMTTNATITTQHKENVLLVPNQTITINEETGQKYVEKVTSGGIIPVEIKTGLANDMVSEVIEGLKEGDQVIARGTSYREMFSEMMRSTFSQE